MAKKDTIKNNRMDPADNKGSANQESMGKRPDPLGREIAITAIIEQNGLKLKTKSRFFAAIDQLLGNIIDWPSTFIESGIDRRRDDNHLARELRHIEGEKIKQVALSSEFKRDIYFERYRQEQMKRDKNKLEIVINMIDDLKRLPPPHIEGDDLPIDPDWLNELAEIAAKKSDRDIQQLWGKLLAGEIRQPGTFSLRTLQRLSALDSADANKIHIFLRYAINNEFVLRTDAANFPQLSFGRMLEMEDLGVVFSPSTLLHNNLLFKKDSDFTYIFSGNLLKIQAKEDFTLVLPILPLTSFGKALAALIIIEPTPTGYMELFSKKIDRNLFSVEKSSLITIQSDGSFQSSSWETVVD